MTEAIKATTFMNLIFIIFLMLSGTVGGLFGEVIYYLAFMIPIALGIYVASGLKIKREEEAGVREPSDRHLSFSLEKGVRLLPVISPSVALIFFASFITSLLLSLVGVSSTPVDNEGLLKMLLIHALVPALFEEALFRYIPMKLLLPYSRRWCVLYSALCFALIHCSFVQMPYAFVAGVIFMLIDVAFESVWPSVILHFINNTASVVWIKYCQGSNGAWIFVGVILFLSSVSFIVLFKHRKRYAEILKNTMKKSGSFDISYAPVILIIICFYIATVNLIN